MTAKENVLAQITRLLEGGAMPWSTCSGSLRKMVQPLCDAGVLVKERSGGGQCLVVRDAPALRAFRESHFPDHIGAVGLSSRAVGVARFRNSKTFASDTQEIVSVRAWSPSALLRNGQPANAAKATAQHGVFSFLLTQDSPYQLSGVCALVENPAVFIEFERLQLPVGLAILWQGRASHRLVEWLGGSEAQDFQLLHLPDYDPVGLTEFMRLRTRLGGRVHLHLPDDLEHRFARFSNRGLLDKQRSRAMLAKLRRVSTPEVCAVVALVDRFNAGLEQEALMIDQAG